MIEDYEYQELIRPINLFQNQKEIIDFCKLANSEKELNAFIEYLIRDEMYEEVILVKKFKEDFFKK